MTEVILLGLTFVLVTALSFAVFSLVRGGPNAVDQRLARPGAEEEEELLLGGLTPALAGQIPLSRGGRETIQRRMREAGIYRPTAVTEFAAVRAILVILPLLVTGVLAAVMGRAWLPYILVGGICVAILGYSVPRIWLDLRARARARAIERGLPVAVDLLSLCLAAGQNIQAALVRVSREIRFSNPVLADELEILRKQAELRSLEHALQQFADRVQVPVVRNLALILAQSERLGTDTAAALLEYSSNLRITMRQRADTQANRSSFWMLFPTLLCLWVPAILILIAPQFIELRHRIGNMGNVRNDEERRQMLERAERGRRPPFLTPPTAPTIGNNVPAAGQ